MHVIGEAHVRVVPPPLHFVVWMLVAEDLGAVHEVQLEVMRHFVEPTHVGRHPVVHGYLPRASDLCPPGDVTGSISKTTGGEVSLFPETYEPIGLRYD